MVRVHSSSELGSPKEQPLTDSINDLTNVEPNAPAERFGESQPAPIEPFPVRKVLFGKDGLRAGWSLLIFLALMFGLLRGVNVVSKLLHIARPTPSASGGISLRFLLIGESIPLLVTILVTWIMSKIERRPNSVYGLGGPRAVSNFFKGLAWGVTFLSLLVFTLWKTGLLVFDSRLLFGTEALRYGAVWLLGFILVGLLEEYLTRGYLLFTLTRGFDGIYTWLFKTRHGKAMGFWTGAVLLSILFGLGHSSNPGESPVGLLGAGLASLVFCLSLWRTGSLWWAIGLHATWDWAQSFLYGVADSGLMVEHHLFATHPVGKPLMSGGSTGPEGSVFVLVILAMISLIIIFTLPRGNYGILAEIPAASLEPTRAE
jgi:membrane protease YdiL (CAAX protease family)